MPADIWEGLGGQDVSTKETDPFAGLGGRPVEEAPITAGKAATAPLEKAQDLAQRGGEAAATAIEKAAQANPLPEVLIQPEQVLARLREKEEKTFGLRSGFGKLIQSRY